MPSKNPTPSDRRRGSRAASKDKPKPKPAKKVTAQPPVSRGPAVQEQAILHLFRDAFHPLFSPALPQLLQTVKHHLFNRDYAEAFSSTQNLEAYVVRWSPSRALCYREVFLETCDEVREVFDLQRKVQRKGKGVTAESGNVEDLTTEIVCIGGGAGAEVVAAAAAIKSLLRDSESSPQPALAPASVETLPINSLAISPPHEGSLHLTAVDIADWSSIVNKLESSLTTPPPNTSAKPYLSPETYSVTFQHHDILSTEATHIITPKTSLITLLFTTNELYTQSRSQTTSFFLSLHEYTSPGCLILVLESAGSYSTVKIGEKVFSMGMLLDHTLLNPRPVERDGGDEVKEETKKPKDVVYWEKIAGDEAKWYRLPEGLKYPIDLENMRYFFRVYRRV
ncbi:hypothetical protein RUND412_004470 [Rhizina undulata]